MKMNGVVQENEDENQQRRENVRVPARSIVKDYGVMQANQDEDQQGIEHIREAARSMCNNEVVQVNEEVDQQGVELEHVQDRMLSFLMYAGGPQENEDQNRQEMESVRNILSISFELLKLEDLPGEEEPTPRSEVLDLIKFLHDKGLDAATSEVKRDLKKVNQNHHDISTTMQYVNKYLELMLRMFGSATFQTTICNIMSEAEGDQVPCKHCKVVQENEGEDHLGTEHIQDHSRSFLQWTESIEVPTRSTREYGVVQANEGGNHLGMEHIEDHPRFYMQRMEDIQVSRRSIRAYGVVEAYQDKDRQGIEHIREATRSICDYEIKQVNEDLNQQGIEHIQMVEAYQDKDHQGMEHIREATRSICDYEIEQVNEGLNQQGIEHIQETKRSICVNEVVQVNEGLNQQGVQHIQDKMLSFLMYDGAAQANEDQNQQEIEHVRNILSISFEMLKLGVNENLPGEEQPTPRPEVLNVIKFLHDKGLDSARREVKRDLKKVNQNHHNFSMTVQYVNKYLGLMLRMFDSATFQRTICNIMSKAEGDQVSCKHCKVMQANEGEK